MIFLNIAIPATSTLPVAQAAFATVVAAIRPLLGLGILATMLVVFKPLLAGMLRAALLLVHPRQNREQKEAARNLRNALTISRFAREFDESAPGMAAELRALAARG